MIGISDLRFRSADLRGVQPRRERCARSIRNPHSAIPNGFTLIELLVAISIIATLSAMFLGASRAAMEHSRAARTRTTIDKLHSLLMERWADYETRRVDLGSDVENLVRMLPAEGGHDLRLLALRELMKFEMPDRWSDIDITLNPMLKPNNDRDKATVFIRNVPSVARIYYRRYQQALANAGKAKVDDNEGAECLYQIIMLHTGDGEARTMFSTQDIGDVDEDGLPEFLDGWGNPIEFIRWPAGFVDRSSMMTWNAVKQTGDSANDHDPFDPFRRNWRVVNNNELALQPPLSVYPSAYLPYVTALRESTLKDNKEIGFRTVPLIVSRGPDGVLGLVTAREVITSIGGLFNPYFPNDTNTTYSMGSIYLNESGENLSIDNIDNHMDTTR